MSRTTAIFPRLFVAPRRYDGSPKFRYPVDGLTLAADHWVVHGIFGPEIGPHSQRLGFFPGDHTIEFYRADVWWNVYAVFGPEGQRRGYYCNVGTPATRQADEIVYTDLDIDLLVGPTGAYRLMDEDEYAERAARLGYSDELRGNVQRAVDQLVAAAAAGADLFDGRAARDYFERMQSGRVS
jgi:protein associated with RNAse G/E